MSYTEKTGTRESEAKTRGMSSYKSKYSVIRLLCLVAAGILLISAAGGPAFAKTASKKTKKSARSKILVVDTSKTSSCRAAMNALEKCGADARFQGKGTISAKNYDGLVIPGGNDINPKRYRKKNTSSYGISNPRDALQLAAIKAFVRAEKPIFGICRGEQLLNVYFGGTLIQHISGHRNKTMNVAITKKTLLYSLYGSHEPVYHSHHQCIGKLGKGLVPMAWHERHIEAVYHKTLPVIGVQWHPEQRMSNGAKLIKKFISMCQSNRDKNRAKTKKKK